MKSPRSSPKRFKEVVKTVLMDDTATTRKKIDGEEDSTEPDSRRARRGKNIQKMIDVFDAKAKGATDNPQPPIQRLSSRPEVNWQTDLTGGSMA